MVRNTANNFKHEAVISDALKIAYNDFKRDEYFKAFSELRIEFFWGKH